MSKTSEDNDCTIKQIKEGCEKAGIPSEEKTIAFAVGFLAGKLGMGDSEAKNDAPSTGTFLRKFNCKIHTKSSSQKQRER